MTGSRFPDHILIYAAAVRGALSDLPAPARDQLLADLEDHLAEVAAESEQSLTDRLGTPEAYAAELRAAYGAAPGRRRSRRPLWIGVACLGLATTAIAGLLLAVTDRASKGEDWKYTILLDKAQVGQVRQVVIAGNDAVATSKDGMRHHVQVPDDTAPLAADLSKDNVHVNFETASGWSRWLAILLPNAILLMVLSLPLVGGAAILYVLLDGPHRGAGGGAA